MLIRRQGGSDPFASARIRKGFRYALAVLVNDFID
jgi:hypothetical protein